MRLITFTLLSDGSSDRCLLPHIQWTIDEALADETYQLNAQWADLRGHSRPANSLADRIRRAVDLYPCDLLFIHRDSEGQPHTQREQEITAALDELGQEHLLLPVSVKLIPVRMQEAWLLIDEDAIRAAAGNPRGRIPLSLPRLATLEGLPKPKEVLHTALRTATELSTRRLQTFSPEARAHQIGDCIADFRLLRQLPSFQRLEAELRQAIATLPAASSR